MEIPFPKNFVPTPFKYHEEVELEISDINNLGDGIGRINGWVVMVPHVCIGEIVRVKIYKNLKNYSLADLVEVLAPSKFRIAPRCELFGSCGGCQYQHMEYQEQLGIKQHQVTELMKRLAGIDCSVNPCLYCHQRYNYRSKITPHFQKNVPPIGFLRKGQRHIVDVANCPIATERINSAMDSARESVISKGGLLKRGGTLLLRDTGDRVVSSPNAIVSENVNDLKFLHRAGEFFQNNPYMLPLLIDFVARSVSGPKYLVDAYCGVGVFGIAAAKNFQAVTGIEISDSAVKLARENAQSNLITNIDFMLGRAEEIFRDLKYPGSETSIVIDPPRSGCSGEFLKQVIKFSPQKIVYVSCSPDTQARDLKIMVQHYSVAEVQPIDMFPQTRHIENVAVLIRKI